MRRLSSIFYFFCACAWIGCEEVPPAVNFSNSGGNGGNGGSGAVELIYKDTSFVATPPAAQNKIVVLEEFTGVRCVNCPAGHETSQSIADQHANRIALVGIHAGFLTAPYPESEQNFVLPEGEALYDYLSVEAVPAAAINRVKFDSEDNIAILNRNVWGGKVITVLDTPPPVNVYTYLTFDEETRALDVYVQSRYTQSASEEHFMTVYLTESNIVDPQLVPEGNSSTVDYNYTHRHVLRAVLTPALGSSLGNNHSSGDVIVKKISYTLPADFKAADCDLIAFVHRSQPDKQILQGSIVKLIK